LFLSGLYHFIDNIKGKHTEKNGFHHHPTGRPDAGGWTVLRRNIIRLKNINRRRPEAKQHTRESPLQLDPG
jgi:hypothetical protein